VLTCPACGKDNPEGFRFCGFCSAQLREDTAVAGEERKVVSVLFCDLVGFTAASEAADPEDVRARLVPYHERLRERIEAFGGTVEKFIGDAVMAVFGAPVAHEDDPERAVRAGLAALTAIEELNAVDDSLALSVRVGVNTGEALVSLAARPQLGEGLVTGDVVNTAARIQALGPVGGVAVGEGTYRATKLVFDYAPLEAISAKGKSSPVPIWQALKPRARFGSDVMRSMSTPLVGRHLDLALLRGTFDKVVAERSCHLVTVVGEPGVGKSRLVAELFAHIDGLPQVVRWRQGRCLPYGESITFWPIGEIVKAHAGIFETDPAELAAAKLEAVLPASDERPWLRARLQPLLGMDPGGQASHEELFAAWRRFFESIAERDPLVLVVEDLHWADAPMLAFLEHLADWSQGVPLILVCTARPELYDRNASWAAALRNTTTIRLSPLSDGETSTLIGELMHRAVLPLETRQVLLERAGGNPLYAEEFVRMLHDRGLLNELGALRSDVDVPFPDSLHSLIAARLDALTPERKSLLQDAAVVGKVFWSGALVDIGDRDARSVEVALHELAHQELVRPARESSMEGEREHGFWHVLVRDVCYAQIPRSARASRHRRVAAWIEQKAPHRLEDLADVLAYHYLQALELSRASRTPEETQELEDAARRYLGLAGVRALALDVAGAETSLSRALALTPTGHPERAGLLQHWASAAQQLGRLKEARAALEEAFVLERDAGRPVAAGRVLVSTVTVLWSLGDPRRLEVIAEALALLETQPPGPELVAARAALAGARMISSDFPAATAEADRALALSARLGLPEPARALGFRGIARCFLGDAEGVDDMNRALELSLQQGDSRGAAVLLANLAIASAHFEGPTAAVARSREARVFCEGRGIAESLLMLAVEEGSFLAESGQVAQALSDAGPLIEQAEDRGNLPCLIKARSLQVRLLVRSDETPQDAGLAERLAAASRGTGVPELMALGFAGAAELLLAQGRPQVARSLLVELAETDAARADAYYGALLPELVRCALALGDSVLARGLADGVEPRTPLIERSLSTVRAALAELDDPAGAAALFGEVAHRWQEFGQLPEQARALLCEGRCRLAAGLPGAAEPLLRAKELFTSMGLRRAVAEADALLASPGATPP
jgi:class 3 adenylate cyclase/tetratricopeptide (TPR) repeat protein